MGARDRSWGGGLARRLLAPFAELQPDEATTALLLAAQAFLVLAAYYLLKPVRESWSLPGVGGLGGAELKTYLAAAQALGLVLVARAHDALALRLRRDRRVGAAVVFAIACLVAFDALHAAGLDVTIAFFLWLGAFQLVLVAQLSAFATDLCTAERGRRLFAVIGARGPRSGRSSAPSSRAPSCAASTTRRRSFLSRQWCSRSCR